MESRREHQAKHVLLILFIALLFKVIVGTPLEATGMEFLLFVINANRVLTAILSGCTRCSYKPQQTIRHNKVLEIKCFGFNINIMRVVHRKISAIALMIKVVFKTYYIAATESM